jgi:hypothetical protein
MFCLYCLTTLPIFTIRKGRWQMKEHGAPVEWHWQGKAEVQWNPSMLANFTFIQSRPVYVNHLTLRKLNCALSSISFSLPTHCTYRGLLFHLITLNDTNTQSLGLLWARDRPDSGTSIWQHTAFTRDRHPCRRRDSNQQSQQSSGDNPTP